MRKIDNMNDTTDVNEEKRESPFYSFFDADLVFDIIKIVILILVLVSSLFGISKCFKLLGEKVSYNSKASVSAGIITDKEIINGHTKSDGGLVYYNGKFGYGFNNNKSYVPTVYRIYIRGEFEYEGKTHQGNNSFDVSEDIYNSYNIGDYFDSKDLLRDSGENQK